MDSIQPEPTAFDIEDMEVGQAMRANAAAAAARSPTFQGSIRHLRDLGEAVDLAGPGAPFNPRERLTEALSAILSSKQVGDQAELSRDARLVAQQEGEYGFRQAAETLRFVTGNPQFIKAAMAEFNLLAASGPEGQRIAMNATLAAGALVGNDPNGLDAVAFASAVGGAHGIRNNPAAIGGVLAIAALANDPDRLVSNLRGMSESSVEYAGETYNSFQFAAKNQGADILLVSAPQFAMAGIRAATALSSGAASLGEAAYSALGGGIATLQRGSFGTEQIEAGLGRYGITAATRYVVSLGPGARVPQPGEPDFVGPSQQSRFATLRERVEALGSDPERGFIRAEGVGGVRIEQSLGRTIIRSQEVAVDFVDDVLGPISLKGPIPARGSVEGLANSAIRDANQNTATSALFVDLRGLSAAQRDVVRQRVQAQTASSNKQIIFLD